MNSLRTQSEKATASFSQPDTSRTRKQIIANESTEKVGLPFKSYEKVNVCQESRIYVTSLWV